MLCGTYMYAPACCVNEALGAEGGNGACGAPGTHYGRFTLKCELTVENRIKIISSNYCTIYICNQGNILYNTLVLALPSR